MVGVPGRSKACHTCRQRRIKCDGGRPGCTRCAKSNRICTGYQRKHAFVLSKDMEGLALESAETPLHLADEDDSGKVVVSRWRKDNDIPAPPTRMGLKSDPSQYAPSFSKFQELVYPPPLINSVAPRYALRDQLLGAFLQSHLPNELILRHRSLSKSKNFLLQIPDIPELSPALESSVLAVCLARLGRINGQHDLCCGSLSLYSDSMRHLQKAIANPATQCDDQTLAASTILTMYELTECPGLDVHGYWAHINGAMRLLRLRGPSCHSSGLAHSLFHSLRMHGVFHSLAENKPSFLTQPDWRELPFKSCKKGLYDEILDHLLELSSLLAERDPAEGDRHLHNLFIQLLEGVAQCWRIDQDLDSWYARFDASIAGPLYWPELSNLDSAADSEELGMLFPVVFHFPALIVAQTLNMYWVMLLMLYMYLGSQYKKLREIADRAAKMEGVPCTCGDGKGKIRVGGEGEEAAATAAACLKHFDPEQLSPLGHRAWPETVARKICQSAEFFLQDRMGCLGCAAITPGLVTVGLQLEMFDGDWSRERIFVKEMLERINTKGIRLAKYL